MKYGGVEGVVTLEDLIEEIVGEIEDEYDVEEMSYREIDEKNFLIDAGMTLEKFNQIFPNND